MGGKKFFGYLLALVILTGGLAAGIILVKQPQDIREKAAGEDVVFSLSPADVQTVPDSTFTLDITLDTGSKIVNGAELIIRFDKDALEALELNPGSIFSAYPGIGRVVDNNKGEIRLLGMAFNYQTGTVDTFSGSGKFGDIKFRAKKQGESSVNFVFTPGDTTDTNVVEKGTYLDVLTKAAGSRISVSDSTPTPTPTGQATPTPTAIPTATPTATPTAIPTPTPSGVPTGSPTPTPTPPGKIPGDINTDGCVNALDIGMIVENYTFEEPPEPIQDTRADINGDGRVNAADISVVIEHYDPLAPGCGQ